MLIIRTARVKIPGRCPPVRSETTAKRMVPGRLFISRLVHGFRSAVCTETGAATSPPRMRAVPRTAKIVSTVSAQPDHNRIQQTFHGLPFRRRFVLPV